MWLPEGAGTASSEQTDRSEAAHASAVGSRGGLGAAAVGRGSPGAGPGHMLLIAREEYFLHDCLKIESVFITTACRS